MSDTVVVKENGLGRYQQTIMAGENQLIADEPISVGGTGLGLAPFELVMAGLGACTSMTLRMYAERKGLALTSVEVALSHEKREVDGVQRDCIQRNITLHGELSPEIRKRLLEIANKCPVHRALSQSFLLDCKLGD